MAYIEENLIEFYSEIIEWISNKKKSGETIKKNEKTPLPVYTINEFTIYGPTAHKIEAAFGLLLRELRRFSFNSIRESRETKSLKNLNYPKKQLSKGVKKEDVKTLTINAINEAANGS